MITCVFFRCDWELLNVIPQPENLNGPFFPLFSGMHLFDYFFVQREIKVEFWQLKYYNEIGSEIEGHMSSMSEIRVFEMKLSSENHFPTKERLWSGIYWIPKDYAIFPLFPV